VHPGPAPGQTATLTFTVTPAMAASVGRRRIHPVYGTAAFVEHVEQVCRGMLEPHLEEGEEGVGYRLEVVHRAPAPVGAELVLTATAGGVGPRRSR
jgi:predicted thioesterase